MTHDELLAHDADTLIAYLQTLKQKSQSLATERTTAIRKDITNLTTSIIGHFVDEGVTVPHVPSTATTPASTALVPSAPVPSVAIAHLSFGAGIKAWWNRVTGKK